MKERKAKQKVAQLPTRILKINEPSSECTICLEENIQMIDACINVVNIDKKKNIGDFLTRRTNRMECFVRAHETQIKCKNELVKSDLGGALQLDCKDTVRMHTELMCVLHTPEN